MPLQNHLFGKYSCKPYKASRGKFKGQLSSVDEFIARKQEGNIKSTFVHDNF